MCFYVWKGTQKEEYQKQFNKDKNFWSAVSISLEETWLQSLANIYEHSGYSKSGKVLSVSSLLRDQKDKKRRGEAEGIISKNREVIENISILRSKQLAHNNLGHLHNPKNMLRKKPIKYGKVESLLKETEKLLHCLHPADNHSYCFGLHNKESEKSSEMVMKRIEYCMKEEEKFYEKQRREVKHEKFFDSE